MNLDYLILEKKVKEADDAITQLALHAFSDRVIPQWLPPEYGKKHLSIKIPIDYLTDENIEKFQKELKRLVGIRVQMRIAQAQKKLELDMTKVTEIVPS